MVALCVNDLFEEIAQQADNILNSDLDFKTKLDHAFALCQEKMSQQISDYFQDKMVEDSVFSTLLAKAITVKKRDIYRAYIELGKEEGLIAEDLSTELILNVIVRSMPANNCKHPFVVSIASNGSSLSSCMSLLYASGIPFIVTRSPVSAA